MTTSPFDRIVVMTNIGAGKSEIRSFVAESNFIEGIVRPPAYQEVEATTRFLMLSTVTTVALGELQAVYAPGHPIREREDMNVRVGNYFAPAGGPAIIRRLQAICRRANQGADVWKTHCQFEMLHPYMDGNGRTGRALWAWQMLEAGHDPFRIGFLHRFYYQTLENSGS